MLILPKRWFFLEVGVYGDYEFQAGCGADFGSVYSAGFNINLGKKNGIQISLNYNSSFIAVRNITAREFILSTAIRLGESWLYQSGAVSAELICQRSARVCSI